MNYITHTPYKSLCIHNADTKTSRPVSIQKGARLEEKGGILCTLDGKRICAVTSEDAHQHFARNDDGCGLERGRLTQSIQSTLRQEKAHQERWDKVRSDPLCQKYKRPEHDPHWLWNHAFFNAPLWDLQYIDRLVKSV